MNQSVNLTQRVAHNAIGQSLTEFVDTIRKVFPGAEFAVFLARLITLVNTSGFAETVDIIGQVSHFAAPALSCEGQRKKNFYYHALSIKPVLEVQIETGLITVCGCR